VILKKGDGVLVPALGAIHGKVRVAQQDTGIGAIARVKANTDTGRDLDGVAGNRDGHGQVVEDLAGYIGREVLLGWDGGQRLDTGHLSADVPQPPRGLLVVRLLGRPLGHTLDEVFACDALDLW